MLCRAEKLERPAVSSLKSKASTVRDSVSSRRVFSPPLAKNEFLRRSQDSAARRKDEAELVRLVDDTIWSIARSYGRNLGKDSVEDLYSAGKVGALRAARRFDPDHDSKSSFNSYASRWIRLYVIDEALFFWGKGRCGTSNPVRQTFFGYARAVRYLVDKGEDPTIEAVAGILGVTPKTLADIVSVVAAPDVGYDEPVSQRGGNTLSLSEVVPDEGVVESFKSLLKNISVEKLSDALETLKEKERTVILGRFYEDKTLEALGESLYMTKEGIRQVEKRALQKLRDALGG